MPEPMLQKYGIDPHPIERRATVLMAIGGAALLIAGRLAFGDAPLSAIGPFAAGASLLFSGREAKRVGVVVPAVNRAVQEARAGRADNAVELIDYVRARTTNAYLLRATDHQRALLACHRGDMEGVVEHTTELLARRTSWRAGIHGRAQVPNARGLRAFALASLDRRDDAAADVEATTADPVASPEALAFAELAQAVTLERSGERDALRAHLHEHRELLAEHTGPRERELVRALHRLLAAGKQSVYREPAGTDGARSVEEWVAAVAPDAGPFARAEGDAPLPDAAASPSDAASRSLAARTIGALTKPPVRRNPMVAMLVLWFGLIVAFLAVWTVLAPPVPGGGPALVGPEVRRVGVALVPFLLMVGLIGVFATVRYRSRTIHRELFSAAGQLARGDHEPALAKLTRLSRSRRYITAASAHDLLAKWEARAGRLEAALRHTDEGLSHLGTAQLRALASDSVLPSLLALRAWCLAALDRNDQAETVLTTLRTSFGSYYDLDAAVLRVRTIQAAVAGDVARLAELSNARAELGLSPRDELLLDLGRAAAAPGSAGAGEIARLRALVRSEDELVRWARQLAPSIVAAFERAIQPELH